MQEDDDAWPRRNLRCGRGGSPAATTKRPGQGPAVQHPPWELNRRLGNQLAENSNPVLINSQSLAVGLWDSSRSVPFPVKEFVEM